MSDRFFLPLPRPPRSPAGVPAGRRDQARPEERPRGPARPRDRGSADDVAEAVIDAGLIWIGPGPDAIRVLGDKVAARHIAAEVGAPLVPGTPDPVNGPEEVVAFAKEHGLPIAIKAAFGGGGRGLKVARTMEEIEELYASAVREASAVSASRMMANSSPPSRATTRSSLEASAATRRMTSSPTQWP